MNRTLAIVGPTASGKTGLSLDLAERLDGEIVNADALQVYRDLEIGTDKPDAVMRQRIRHHLVDVLNPDDSYSAGEFARRARQAITDIHQRGKLALVVGGSGLYQRALFQGLSQLPKSQPEVRQQLTQELDEQGLPRLYQQLSEVDPQTANRLTPKDTQRILRALEVYRISDRTMSSWLQSQTAENPPLTAFRIGLTLPRSILYDRIADRISQMVERGWLTEIEVMLDKGVDPSSPAFQAIGYRQMVRHIKGDCSLGAAIDDTVLKTRRYAKRQLTWFRKERDILWLPAGITSSTVLYEIKSRGAFAR